MKIVLDPSDTYTMTFSRFRGNKITVVRTVSDVYGDMVRNIFTDVTGLRTSL